MLYNSLNQHKNVIKVSTPVLIQRLSKYTCVIERKCVKILTFVFVDFNIFSVFTLLLMKDPLKMSSFGFEVSSKFSKKIDTEVGRVIIHNCLFHF